MRISLAYIAVILLWSTTPLAIKWSGEGPGFIFGVTARMVIGALCILSVLLATRRQLVWNRKARLTYLVVGLQIYGAMTSVYWGAQFIPSGWISVIFGLTPLLTALFAAIYLNEHEVTPGKVASFLLGVCGLAVMFGSALELGAGAVMGIAAVIVAALLQSLSAVWVKYLNADLSALNQVAGGLLLALPAYLVTWGIVDGHWPAVLSRTNIASILYLGMIATTIGFVLYYYLLTHLAATRVALITLISPVLALILGRTINHEPLTLKVVSGSALILTALLAHEYFDRWVDPKRRIRANTKCGKLGC
ncbi:MAG: DMT family transporter [Gammaproteobacteria bacterium]